MTNVEKIYGTKLEILQECRSTWARLEEVGYQYRGVERRGRGEGAHLLSVWTRGHWLVRFKHYYEREEMEIAAFDQVGILCPLEEALRYES